MITAGIDIGSVSTKAVIIEADTTENYKLISQSISPTGSQPKRAAETTLQKALSEANLSLKNLNYIISTGYGRRTIEFGNETLTEITCCAKGSLSFAKFLEKQIRTIIDLGGQDTKVILLDDQGNVIDFLMNDKCSAGTGRFLEVMSNVLGIDIEDFNLFFQKAKAPVKINSTCTVFAESEVISLITQGAPKEDIIAGLCHSIAEKIASMVKQVGGQETIFFCGGGAKNYGIKKALEEKLKKEIYTPQQPQFVVALGAALIAKDRCLIK